MKIKLATTSIAAAIALSSMGAVMAGELYTPSEGSYTPTPVTTKPVAVYEGGGELHLAAERRSEQFVASANKAPPVSSVYARGGMLYFPPAAHAM